MMNIGGDHEIPFGRSARDRLSYNLAHVPGHRPGGNKLYIDTGSVFFIECLSDGLGAVSLQSGWPVKIQSAFFFGGGDQIIQRRGGSNSKPLDYREDSG